MKEFKTPYICIEQQSEGYAVLYNAQGDYSVILHIENPILQWSGDLTQYDEFHSFYTNLLKLFDEGYIVQKQDLFYRKKYSHTCDNDDFLDNEYFKLFEGREYTETETYLIITKEAKKGFFSFDADAWDMFRSNITRILQMFDSNGYHITALDKDAVSNYLHSYMSGSFSKEHVALDNYKSTRKNFWIGEREVRVMSVVDIDNVDMPAEIGCYRTERMGECPFPVDMFAFLPQTPDVHTLIYNQLIYIPDQQSIVNRLNAKFKRHQSVPDAGNHMAMEDIDAMLGDMVRYGKQVVYTHFNFTLIGPGNLDKACNFLAGQLNGRCGMYPSKQCYNQFPLFVGCMPGNGRHIKDYDRFLVPAEAAICFLYKEARQKDEEVSFLTYFCDRQGVPLAFDPFYNIITTQRCPNANKFVLGPSGSGKSFFMNEYVRQLYRNGVEIVLVDVGNSYSGLNEYYGGRYITYTDDNPITMNPFRITIDEYNEEKRNFLKSLITLLWKGGEAKLSQVEDSLVGRLITKYYDDYFQTGKDISYLGFNSFYDFAVPFVSSEIAESHLGQYAEEKSFAYVLKDFYKGGQYERTLNDDIDRTLFNEKLIVFEVDNIKDNPRLFPIVTLVIMDLFIQKMRLKKGGKSLIIEEAWKAIATPTMAEYLQYLYKTVRKFNGEAIVVTQELKDLLSNETIKDSIIANSGTVILLDQATQKKNFGSTKNILGITDTEEAKIFSINQLPNRLGRNHFKEVYIRRGQMGEVYGTEVSAAQYYTYTTTRIEKEAVNVFFRAYEAYEKNIMEEWMRLRSDGLSDKDVRTYRNLKEEWRKHFNLHTIALSGFIEEQRRSGLSNELWARKVNGDGYRVPVKTEAYEKIDF